MEVHNVGGQSLEKAATQIRLECQTPLLSIFYFLFNHKHTLIEWYWKYNVDVFFSIFLLWQNLFIRQSFCRMHFKVSKLDNVWKKSFYCCSPEIHLTIVRPISVSKTMKRKVRERSTKVVKMLKKQATYKIKTYLILNKIGLNLVFFFKCT